MRAVEALEPRAFPGGDAAADRVVELRGLDPGERVRTSDDDLDPPQPVRAVTVVVGVAQQDVAPLRRRGDVVGAR